MLKNAVGIYNSNPTVLSVIDSTLTDNATTNIVVGDKTASENIVIKYSVTRSTEKQAGQLSIINKTSSVEITQRLFDGDDIGLTFNVDFDGNDIRLKCILSNTGNDASFKYKREIILL